MSTAELISSSQANMWWVLQSWYRPLADQSWRWFLMHMMSHVCQEKEGQLQKLLDAIDEEIEQETRKAKIDKESAIK